MILVSTAHGTEAMLLVVLMSDLCGDAYVIQGSALGVSIALATIGGGSLVTGWKVVLSTGRLVLC